MSSIIIAEDSSELAGILKALLSTQGHVVSGIAATGAEAIELVKKINPDLVLMDIKLSGSMDGINAAANIKTGRADIPVIFLTGLVDTETRTKAMKVKPSAYITKPFSCRDLLRSVDRALAHH
jgi:CheY-like chemotaxis protein